MILDYNIKRTKDDPFILDGVKVWPSMWQLADCDLPINPMIVQRFWTEMMIMEVFVPSDLNFSYRATDPRKSAISNILNFGSFIDPHDSDLIYHMKFRIKYAKLEFFDKKENVILTKEFRYGA